MAGNEYFQEKFKLTKPRTYIAIQKLVVSMSKVVKSQGKKTWFGRDKGLSSLQDFFDRLSDAITAMKLEKRIHDDDDAFGVQAALIAEISEFELAHPNWQDAYGFFNFFVDPEDTTFDSEAIIERARRF